MQIESSINKGRFTLQKGQYLGFTDKFFGENLGRTLLELNTEKLQSKYGINVSG